MWTENIPFCRFDDPSLIDFSLRFFGAAVESAARSSTFAAGVGTAGVVGIELSGFAEEARVDLFGVLFDDGGPVGSTDDALFIPHISTILLFTAFVSYFEKISAPPQSKFSFYCPPQKMSNLDFN